MNTPLLHPDGSREATLDEKRLLLPFLFWKQYIDWHNPPKEAIKRMTTIIEHSRIVVYQDTPSTDPKTMAVYWRNESQSELFRFGQRSDGSRYAMSVNYYPDQMDYIYDP